MSHFLGEFADAIFGEESGFIYNEEEAQEDFERSDALRGLMNDIHSLGSTISLPEFDDNDDYITLDVDSEDLEASVYEDGDEEEMILNYQQNRADAYAYAAVACAQQEQRGALPRVDWKREGF
jgi:hypothetical protein